MVIVLVVVRVVAVTRVVLVAMLAGDRISSYVGGLRNLPV